MEVVTYLASTLIIVACVSVLALVLRHVVAQNIENKALRLQEGQVLVASASALAGDAPGPTPVLSGHAPSLDGFVCQFIPVETELHVYSNMAVFAPCVGPVHVHNGGRLLLFGTAASSVSVRPGGSAVVYGLVAGDVVNEGGDLQLFGRVIGSLDERAGKTTVHTGAIVARAG